MFKFRRIHQHLSHYRAVGIRLLITLLLLGTADCGIEQIESGQHAVIFSSLPTFLPGPLRGGVHGRIVGPGEKVFVLPWERIYRLDTSVQSIGWGGVGYGDNKTSEDYMETRALDGNEVGLAVTVQYNVKPEMISYIIQRVGVDDASIRRLVSSVGRAEIRTHMNTLRTPDYFSPELRQKAVNSVRDALAKRLGPEGIEVGDVIYYDHRFERRLPNGEIDRTYQTQIDETQRKYQETEQEKKVVITAVEEKKQLFNEEQARFNRAIEEAEGFKTQATLRGDSYLEAKRNEAEQILATGMAEVEGLKKQVAALAGPGGRALLRLAVTKALLAKDPKFFLVNSGGDKGIDVNRVDTNELLRQAGFFAVTAEGMKPKESGSATGQASGKLPAKSGAVDSEKP